MGGHRVLMVGVDAAELSFIRAGLNRLPTFRRLLDEARLLPLRSTADHIPASVWPTMYTGSPPGDHGISQHIQWDPDEMRMRRITSDWLYCEPFWYDLARAGRRAVVLDVPFTFESRLGSVVEISNWGSHDLMGAFQAQPAELGRELQRRFGHHPMGYEIPVSKDARQLVGMRRECVDGARTKGQLIRFLRDSTEWDFFLAVFGECHRAGHILWRNEDDADSAVPEGALLDVYASVDTALAEVLDGVDLATTTLVVFSLHGMGANFSQEHFVRRVMDRVNARFLRSAAPRDDPPESQRGLIRVLREAIPASIQHAVARSVPVHVRDWVVCREVTGGLDWAQTPGFALRSDLFSFLRLNVVGREPQGYLEPGSDQHQRYLGEAAQAFLGLRSVRTGAPIVSEVVRTEDAFPGVRQRLLPDLIVRWANEPRADEVRSDALGVVRAAPDSGRTGEHRPDGFALILGRDARTDGLPPLGSNADFPRFVRHLMGLRPGG